MGVEIAGETVALAGEVREMDIGFEEVDVTMMKAILS